MAQNSWLPDPALPAWIGLGAVLLLLLAYTLMVPQPARLIIERGPFESPILLEERSGRPAVGPTADRLR